MATLTIKKNSQSLSLLAAAECVSKHWHVDVREGANNTLNVNSAEYSTTSSILRFIARSVPQLRLYGQTAVERTEVDHWLDFNSLHLNCSSEFADSLAYLDNQLSQATYIVGYQLTIADLAIWATLYGSDDFQTLIGTDRAPKNVLRYFNMLSAKAELKKVAEQVPKAEAAGKQQRKEEGKFIELPGAEMGKVVVRFPPEASGYLHIGHAKAALLNQYYQQTFNGKLIFRFDDTNPAKENAEFELVILKDIEMLGLKPDLFTHTSDHFDSLQKYCEKMIRDGNAYVDDTEPEKMKQEREQKIESASRQNSVEKNLALWKEMIAGSEQGLKCCVRAKIDMAHDVGCMRDPTMYRCKLEPHVRTGHKYKVYPTYDFACPIVDSVENVTHALRTTEYHDRDEQYFWFLEALGLRKPYIYEYSRLNLQNTVMSKRKLTWFVDEKIVDGWDDPRFPTVRGVMRRGMTVDGLKEFIVAQGSSRSINMMEWDKIWAFNRKVIDPIAPRFTALLKSEVVPVTVDKAVVESKQVPRHPKDAAIGTRSVWYGPNLFIDGADAELLKEGEMVTFINWGNLVIKKINKGKDGKIQSLEASLALENTDYKKTQKITWLADVEKAPPVATLCLHYDHIISKPVIEKDEDFKKYINRNSKVELQMLGDPELASLKKGDIIQLQRRGYYICDVPYEAPSRHSCVASPCVLIKIPDGHTKEMPTSGSKHKETGDAAAATPVAPPAKAKGKDNKAPAAKDAQVKDNKTPAAKDAQVKDNKTPAAKDAQSKDSKAQPKADNKAQPTATGGADALSEQVRVAGEKVRQLKADKAAKADIDAAVKVLLQLKADYKSATGADWQPGAAPAVAAVSQPAAASGADALSEQVRVAGEKVRQLKADKAAKADIDAAVKVLLQLKADYKSATGNDWQPTTAPAVAAPKQVESKPSTPAPVAMGDSSSAAAAELKQKIDAQGEVVRQLKASKAAKDNIDAEVKKLLALKEDYKKLTGEDVAGGQQRAKKEEKPKAAPAAEKAKAAATHAADAEADGDSREVKKVTRLGLEAKKAENLPDWYSQVITKAEMIEYYDISGCYVLRPWAYGIWERIANWFDAEIKKIGFENCYFPIFVSAAALEKEKEHIADFAPEVAWVTRSGKTDLAEPIAIRPTSETVMYPSYAKWVQSHRDLPIKLNQWNNVVRWEFKHPQPFLRTREFLWQEGHSAYAGYDEAEKEVYHILGLYENIYENLLAIPVTKGKKTQKEKFAGGDYTTTVEVYISASGRGIQAATSHHLGQNFSKMFNISFEDPDTKERRFAYQNSWAITTRSLGIVVMTHGDDKGLVLPPRIAPVQVVVVPCGITKDTTPEDLKKLMDGCESLCDELAKAGVRVKGDYRDNYSPGWKFNHWELKGVPIRVELGPRDLQKGEFVAVRRDTGDKVTFKRTTGASDITALIDNIHNSLFSKAKKDLDDNTAICYEMNSFCQALEKKKVILAPFCGGIKCEEQIKETSANNATAEPGAAAMGAKSLCIPFKQPAAIKDSDKCVGPNCTEKPTNYVLFGRSY